MAVTSMKRSSVSNTSCFSNLYLIECIRKCKPKIYLKSIMIIIGKDLSMTKKKLDCHRMKMCRGIRLRRVKVKSCIRKWQMRENTFLLVKTYMNHVKNICHLELANLLTKCTLLVIGQIQDVFNTSRNKSSSPSVKPMQI